MKKVNRNDHKHVTNTITSGDLAGSWNTTTIGDWNSGVYPPYREITWQDGSSTRFDPAPVTREEFIALSKKLEDMAQSMVSILDVIRDIAQQECDFGGKCGSCLPCKARSALYFEARRALEALAS